MLVDVGANHNVNAVIQLLKVHCIPLGKVQVGPVKCLLRIGDCGFIDIYASYMLEMSRQEIIDYSTGAADIQ